MNKLTGTNVILDSNIIIYYFNDEPSVTNIVEDNFLHTSIITEIEVLGFKLQEEKQQYFIEFFDDINTYPISSDIKKKAIFFKQYYKLKTADSIIAATAASLNFPLISADKIFSRVEELQFFQIEI